MTMIDVFIAAIEDYYGTYANPSIRKGVIDYVGKTYALDVENMDRVINAIKYSTDARHGPPDLATIRYAIENWERDGNTIRKPIETWGTMTPVETNEFKHSNKLFRARAREMGIDPDTNPRWFWRMVGSDFTAVRKGTFQRINWADYEEVSL